MAQHGMRKMNVEVEVGVYDALVALSERIGTTLADQARHAFARHLASPPGGGAAPPMADAPAPFVPLRKRGGRRAKRSGEA